MEFLCHYPGSAEPEEVVGAEVTRLISRPSTPPPPRLKPLGITWQWTRMRSPSGSNLPISDVTSIAGRVKSALYLSINPVEPILTSSGSTLLALRRDEGNGSLIVYGSAYKIGALNVGR